MEGTPVILKKLEKEHEIELNKSDDEHQNSGSRQSNNAENIQMSMFQLNDPLLQKIKEDVLKTDINTLTPVEALLKLNEIKSLLNG